MFALPALRELDDAALQHFQETLLNAFVAGVSGYGIVRAGLARDFVKLVQVNDSVLGFLNVLARRVIEIPHGDLDIRADETRLCQA